MEQWRENKDGRLELIDEHGKVLAVQKVRPTVVRQLTQPDGSKIPSIQKNPGLKKKSNEGKRILKDPVTGQDVWVPETWGQAGKKYPFHRGTWERILDLLLEQEITQICKHPEMPPYKAILAWRRDPERQKEYDDACRGRAEYHRAKALSIADQVCIDADYAAGERLKADLHKWAAESDDRDRFGKQTKVTGLPAAPTLIVITGVPAPLPHQQPPRLGPDGRVIEVPCTVSDPEPDGAA